MISYFKIFVYFLFPPAAALIALLLFPFPNMIKRQIVRLCDNVLYWRPHPYIPVSLIGCVLIVSALTFVQMHADLNQVYQDYTIAKKNGNSDRQLVKLMAEERNIWISGSAFWLWVVLYSYINTLKKYFKLVDSLMKLEQKTKN